MTEDENVLLKRQLGELREQITSKDLELKNYHRTIADLEQQLTEAENVRTDGHEKRHVCLFACLLTYLLLSIDAPSLLSIEDLGNLSLILDKRASR